METQDFNGIHERKVGLNSGFCITLYMTCLPVVIIYKHVDYSCSQTDRHYQFILVEVRLRQKGYVPQDQPAMV